MRFGAVLWLVGAFGVMSCGKSSSVERRRGPPDDSTGGGDGGAGLGGGGMVGGAGTGGAAGGMGGVSVTGGAGGAISGSAGTGGMPTGDPNITGEWAMFSFEDPVAVSLVQNGSELTGRGCCSGFYTTFDIDCCGDIAGGSIMAGRAQFGFSFDYGEHYDYAADVHVSADGMRMLGSFSRNTLPMAWVRLTSTVENGWLTSYDTLLNDAVRLRERGYTLVLSDAPPGGSDFSPDATYQLGIVSAPVPVVRGDLGPFWAGEMSWDEAEQTLVVGPVPTTDPEFPIALVLRFDGAVLTDVEAEMTSGERYVFTPE